MWLLLARKWIVLESLQDHCAVIESHPQPAADPDTAALARRSPVIPTPRGGQVPEAFEDASINLS